MKEQFERCFVRGMSYIKHCMINEDRQHLRVSSIANAMRLRN